MGYELVRCGWTGKTLRLERHRRQYIHKDRTDERNEGMHNGWLRTWTAFGTVLSALLHVQSLGRRYQPLIRCGRGGWNGEVTLVRKRCEFSSDYFVV